MMMSWIDDNAIVGKESDVMDLNRFPRMGSDMSPVFFSSMIG